MLTPEELPHYGYEDYALWKGRWELIEGIPYTMMPSPDFRHQRISLKIARLLDEALDNCDVCRAGAADRLAGNGKHGRSARQHGHLLSTFRHISYQSTGVDL